MNPIKIRKAEECDHKALVALLESNVPAYFHESEVADYESYLKEEKDLYFLAELDGRIVAAGGINRGFDAGKSARIAWDMVDATCHGKGIGRALLAYRLDCLGQFEAIDKVIVRTSQKVYPFYEKSGFALKDIKKDYWAEGFDMYLLEKENTVEK